MTAQRTLDILHPGLLTTVQDGGRPGHAHLGVPPSGAVDLPALRLANRLVGNPETAAALETTLSGVSVRFHCAATVAVTGAFAAVRVDGREVGWAVPVTLSAGAVLGVGPAVRGLRSYLAISGGLRAPMTLGSASTDLLTGLGPPPLAAGECLEIGAPGTPSPVDFAPYASLPDVAEIHLTLGPRDDWFTPKARDVLAGGDYKVSPASNRIGLRLDGPALPRRVAGELPSEGMALGALQVPSDGRPVIFLNDHPTTGGYPVIGVVTEASLATCAQLRPGAAVRFCPAA